MVVIHNEPQCLAEIRSLQSYIQQELNVRAVTFSSDKQKYGVSLRAEPDHKTLGARLKTAFKPITQAIKVVTREIILIIKIIYTNLNPVKSYYLLLRSCLALVGLQLQCFKE